MHKRQRELNDRINRKTEDRKRGLMKKAEALKQQIAMRMKKKVQLPRCVLVVQTLK